MYESDALIEQVTVTVYVDMDMQQTGSMSVYIYACTALLEWAES